MSDTVAPAPRLSTSLPGPRSKELLARRQQAVAAGVAVMLPAFVERGADGLLIDVDGNQLIDFASGIAVTSVGNPSAAVVAAV